jgi:hypothetical protein
MRITESRTYSLSCKEDYQMISIFPLIEKAYFPCNIVGEQKSLCQARSCTILGIQNGKYQSLCVSELRILSET